MPVSVATSAVLASSSLGEAHHALGREEVGLLGIDVAAGDVLHDLGGAAALGVDQEVHLGVLLAQLVDRRGPDAGVHVALAVPDLQIAAGLLGDVGAEPHVRAEQDLGVVTVLLEDVLDDAHGVARRAAVVGLGLDLGRGVDVHHDDRARVLGLPGA